MEHSQERSNEFLLELTAEVVSAYVGNNAVAASDMGNVIRDVFSSLKSAAGEPEQPVAEKPKPAVSVRKSLGHDYLICLEDGKKFKSLKRHLKTHYNLSPEQYREKWGLAADYPMVAPAYAERRSQLAREMGLGQKRRAA